MHFAPELVIALEKHLPSTKKNSRYILTAIRLSRSLRSLITRSNEVAHIHLGTMTPEEQHGVGSHRHWLKACLNSPGRLCRVIPDLHDDRPSVTRYLWRGGLPPLLDIGDQQVNQFHLNYLQSFAERDARQLDHIEDLSEFGRFLEFAGRLSANEIHNSKLGRESGLGTARTRQWLNLLRDTYIWRELMPYSDGKTASINTLVLYAGKRCYDIDTFTTAVSWDSGLYI